MGGGPLLSTAHEHCSEVALLPYLLPAVPEPTPSQQVTLFLKLVYSPELMASESELAPHSALLPRMMRLAVELEASRLVAGLCKVSPAQLVQEGNGCVLGQLHSDVFRRIVLQRRRDTVACSWHARLLVVCALPFPCNKVHLTGVPSPDAKRCWWYPPPRRWPWMGQSCRLRSCR